MTRTRSHITAAAITGIAAAAVLTGVSAGPASAETITVPLRTAVTDLPVADEQRDGYDRDLFPHWIDADGDDCNTRYEVLIAEAVKTPDVGTDCRLTGGEWYSWFDDVTADSPSDISVDHFVPLAEAWDSGAHAWTTEKRRDFANDLGDDRALAAVTISSNSSKGDRDPAEWLPENTSQTCRYVGEWVAVKLRWSLTVDQAEKSALTDLAADCPNEELTVEVVEGGDTTPPPATCGPFSESTAVTIPDTGIATSAVTVSDCEGTASADSVVTVDITHPDAGDLSIWLYTPDGDHHVLKRTGDSGEDVRAEYRVDLSAEDRSGTWTLSVKDYASGGTGTIDSWSIGL
ncbi:uncharacterized protein DUF1524 [Stackebrandtia albiflava]|uniref:Uncharacterized protein DUF1524 n=1 Tax=Stackebrandtia albiflava TaxID=406432 RepID=A0A562V403_9ACTN|nr:proprotein convertase P-domain-containing protein [Stackebrandtia albiflava]TWJ12552.1 uncharacterized protein DUF1524 [Stackebrandtia albiflava]